jgi:lipid-A-disaccharide synthase
VKIVLVAGEHSGDTLGAAVIDAIHEIALKAEFQGIGGPKMQERGLQSWHALNLIAHHGIFEVTKHLSTILRVRRDIIARCLKEKPTLYIGIDAPSFNFYIEAKLKKAGIPTVHIVSPQLWAWRPNRITKIKTAIDQMFVLFPFEEAPYRASGIPVACIGHPLAQEIQPLDQQAARKLFGLSAKDCVITLLPGSRMSEMAAHSHLFIQTALSFAQQKTNCHFIVPVVDEGSKDYFLKIAKKEAPWLSWEIIVRQHRAAIAASDAVLAASGTVTLEVALLERPMLIAYRLNPLTYAIAKHIVKTPWIGLPNILLQDSVIPEFLQDKAKPKNMAGALLGLLEPLPRRKQVEAFRIMREKLHCNTAAILKEQLREFLQPYDAGACH